MRARTFWFLTLPALFVAETAGHMLVAGAIDPTDPRHRVLSNVLEDFALPFVACAVLLAAAILGRRVLASFRAEGRSRCLPGGWPRCRRWDSSSRSTRSSSCTMAGSPR
jgi:hypothetical protein